MSDSHSAIDPGQKNNVNLIYILYLCGFIAGITALIGVIMAYIGRDGAPPELRSHYDNQISIFWKMFVFVLAGLVLTVVLIGALVLLAAAVWLIIRVIKGMQALSAGQPINEPGRWGI
jgi:uncharacterized membrane protein